MRNSQPLRIIRSAALLAAIAVAPAAAQTSGGSTYSILNIGDLQHGITAAASGHGGAEVAVPSASIINSTNPAGWQDLRLVTLQAAVNFEQFQVSDSRSKIYQNNSRLQDFAAGFPFSEKLGGAVAFAIHPYSSVNYRTQVEQDIDSGDSTNTTMRTTFSGRGGISEAYLGASLRPLPWLALGGTANLFFGSITSLSDVSFSSTRLNPSSYQTSRRYIGFGGRAGLQAQPVDELRLGAVFETGSELDRENTLTTTVIDHGQSLLDTLASSSDKLRIPSRVTVGGAFLTGRFMLAADASFQSWGSEQFATARPEQRFSVGIDRIPNTSINATGFERWTFRFGAYYKQTYYQALDGENINQMGLSLGARWPITTPNAFNSATALDVAIELGKRGSSASGLTQELFGRLTVELSVNELWFVRSRR